MVAPAVDITKIFFSRLKPQQQREALRRGRLRLPSGYLASGAVTLTTRFMETAKPFCLLDKLHKLDVRCPIRILHGARDAVVPAEVSQALLEKLPASDLVLSIIKDGDHRLSRPADLVRMVAAVEELLALEKDL